MNMNRNIEETEALKFLERFDELPNFTTTAGWDDSLMRKIAQSKSSPVVRNYFPALGVFVAAVLLFNVGFMLQTLRSTKSRYSVYSEDYRTLSKELFINPISAN